jgi:hypothetical protein
MINAHNTTDLRIVPSHRGRPSAVPDEVCTGRCLILMNREQSYNGQHKSCPDCRDFPLVFSPDHQSLTWTPVIKG